ncbi:MAG: hypothetical protein HY835_11785 [Anaerolineae bacterium]|nr:hypothetical protein [Anaerolineae bacterium]
MATVEERIKILQMVQEGKISAEDAALLLEALEENVRGDKSTSSIAAEMVEAGQLGRKPRWFRVRVTDTDTGKPRVNVRLPISMVSIGLKMGTRFSPEIEGMNVEELMKLIESGEIGQIVDVRDENDGEHVEVFLE